MDSLEQVRNVPILDHQGQSILLRDAANVAEGTAIGQYQRYNMQRTVTVTANIAGVTNVWDRREIRTLLGHIPQQPSRRRLNAHPNAHLASRN
jgi:multidrug efflux pump subunit AcrB